MNNEQVMLDLETLSCNTDACIISIGACIFDSSGIGATFHVTVNNDNGHMDLDTVRWWMQQSDAARQAVWGEGNDVVDCLEAVVEFIGPRPVWGNGVAFDNVVLRNACLRHGIRPWRYTADRCYRTWRSVVGQQALPFQGTKHNALDDAISQANHLVQIGGWL